MSRIRLLGGAHTTTVSPRFVHKKLDVIFDSGRKDDLASVGGGHKRAASMLHQYDPNARPLAQGMAHRPGLRRDNESLACKVLLI